MAESLADIYVHLAAASARARAQYRVSLAFDMAASFLASFIDFVAVLVIFQHLPRLGGWALPEIAFIYGLAGISFGIADLAVGHLDNLGELIRRGTFDVLLVRPLGSLFQYVASELAPRRLGRIGQAAIVLAYACANAHVAWTPGRLLLVPVTIASGLAIFIGVWVAGAVISFWTADAREIANSFTYGGSVLTAYPINIFGEWFRRFMAFVVPLAFVAYYPSLLILGKPDPVLGQPWLGLLSPLIGLASLAAGRGVWALGVRHYRSTGS